jgi:hypothetical protein
MNRNLPVPPAPVMTATPGSSLAIDAMLLVCGGESVLYQYRRSLIDLLQPSILRTWLTDMTLRRRYLRRLPVDFRYLGVGVPLTPKLSPCLALSTPQT